MSSNPRASARPPRTPREAEPPARRAEVLEAALALVAEHGIAGASLRKLASGLGMSQPSLYHYFPSKEALVTQVVEHCASKMVEAALDAAPPRGIDDLPRFARDAVLSLWATEHHPRFAKFLFVVAIESPEHRSMIRRVFEQRLYPGFSVLADAFGRDAAEREDLRQLVRMIVSSLGLPLLEERALFGAAGPSAELLRYADWVVAAGERLLATRAGAPIAPMPRKPQTEKQQSRRE